jgi:hypothetical protein
MQRRWLALVICSLGLVGSVCIPAVTAAQTAGAVCTIRIFADGELLSVFTLPPTHFALAALVPADKDVVVPVLCDDLDSVGLGVASQEKSKEVTFDARVFDHDGIPFCDKGPFTLSPRGGTGVTFASCPEP